MIDREKLYKTFFSTTAPDLQPDMENVQAFLDEVHPDMRIFESSATEGYDIFRYGSYQITKQSLVECIDYIKEEFK